MKWKTPSGLSPLLLEFKVTISKDGKSSYEFCEKPAKKMLFVHHQSAWYSTNQRSISFEMTKMYIEEILTTKHKNAFNGILCLNRYPENNINQTNQRDSLSTNTEHKHRMVIPVRFQMTKPQYCQHFPKGVHPSVYRSQIIHPQTNLLPQHYWA